jgi:prepilin-type N-terminal cleavage/methylation domain-containing protein
MKKGFTLLEILLVIAAIGILAAIVIVAINPNRQLEQVRDAQVQSDMNQLYKALQQYEIDNAELPSELASASSGAIEICVEGASDCTGYVDMTSDLVPIYLPAIPTTQNAEGNGTGYYVVKSSSNQVGVTTFSNQESNQELQSIGLEPLTLDVLEVSSGVIESVTGAFSTRLLSHSYSGPLMRIERTPDNSQLDVNPTSSGELDREAIDDFVQPGESARVITWYDQSGNGRNLTATGNAPIIMDSGNFVLHENQLGLSFIGGTVRLQEGLDSDSIPYPAANFDDGTSILVTSNDSTGAWVSRSGRTTPYINQGVFTTEIRPEAISSTTYTLSSSQSDGSDFVLSSLSFSREVGYNFEFYTNFLLEDVVTIPSFIEEADTIRVGDWDRNYQGYLHEAIFFSESIIDDPHQVFDFIHNSIIQRYEIS